MRKRIIVVFGLAIGTTAVCATSQDKTSAPAVDVIGARQRGMDMSSITLRFMVDAMKAGREATTQQYPAFVLAKWAWTVPTLFPPDSVQGQSSQNTQALPLIWQDRAGFNKAAADYAEATAKLASLAASNDTAAFTKQLDGVQQACNVCHSRYKAGPQAAPSK